MVKKQKMLALYIVRSTCTVMSERQSKVITCREIQKQATSNIRDFMKSVELDNICI